MLLLRIGNISLPHSCLIYHHDPLKYNDS